MLQFHCKFYLSFSILQEYDFFTQYRFRNDTKEIDKRKENSGHNCMKFKQKSKDFE